MRQRVHTALGPGVVVAEESVHGRTQYKVEGEGFSIWAFGNDLFWEDRPQTVDYSNSTTLPYNPRPQHPSDVYDGNSVNLDPWNRLDQQERLSPANSVTLDPETSREYPGPSADLFAGPRDGNSAYRTNQDVWPHAKLSSKFADVVERVNPDSVQAKLDDNPDRLAQTLAYRWHGEKPEIDPRQAAYFGLVEHDAKIRTAAWRDVRAKAIRLRQSGAIDVMAANPQAIYANVQGDHGRYETIVVRSGAFTGSHAISEWSCTCKWGEWAFQRQHTFVGRLCSHAYSTYMELQSMHLKKNRPADSPFAASVGGEFDYDPAFLRWAGLSTAVLDKMADQDFETLEDTWESERRAALNDQSTTGYDPTVDTAAPAAPELPADPAASTQAYDPTVKSSGRLPQWGNELTTEPGTLDFIDNNISYSESHGRDREDVHGEGLIAWGQKAIGIHAAIEDIQRVLDPNDNELLERLRSLVEEGERPQHQKERNSEMRTLVTELRLRGYGVENLTAAIEVEADYPQPGDHEPFAGSGPLESLEFEPSADYVDRKERGKFERVDVPGVNDVEQHQPDKDWTTASAETGPAWLMDGGGVPTTTAAADLYATAEVIPEDHGFKEASADSILAWASEGASDSADPSAPIKGNGIAVAADDPALAMFTPAPVAATTAAVAPEGGDPSLAWLLGGDTSVKTAGRQYSQAEQAALINEAAADGTPIDQTELDLRGTHYL
jgi:hypothetical protein